MDHSRACCCNHRSLLDLVLRTVPLGLLIVFFASGYLEQDEQRIERLRVRELAVVDAKGVVRARLGGSLPDAVIAGRRMPRGEQAAGLLLYDDTGQERGGYVTWEPSGNVGLTLDTRREQVALFAADPEAGCALRLWNGDDSIELRAGDDAGPRWTVAVDGEVLLQEPSVQVSGEACDAYHRALETMTLDEVLRICRQRFSAEACRACLEGR